MPESGAYSHPGHGPGEPLLGGGITRCLAASGMTVGRAAGGRPQGGPGRVVNTQGPLAAPFPLLSSQFRRGRSSVVERQLPKLHVVGSIPIGMPRNPVGSIVSNAKGMTFLRCLTEKEFCIADSCHQQGQA